MKIPVTVSALAVVVATLLEAQAQNVTQCLDSCLDQAAAANGCDLSSVQCVCTNITFQEAALDCLQKNCTIQDVQDAETWFLRDCGEMHHWQNASSLPIPSTTTSSSLASSSSSPSSSPSPSPFSSSSTSTSASHYPTASFTLSATSTATETETDASTTTVTLTVVDPTSSSSSTSSKASIVLIPTTPPLTTDTTPSSAFSSSTQFTTSWDVAAMYSSLVSPRPSTPSTGGHRLSTDTVVGIAVGSCVAAICLALSSCLYIKRRRGRARRWARMYPFVAHREPQTSDARKGSSASDPLLGASRDVLDMVEEGRTQTDGSAVARVSFVGSESRVPSPCCVAHLPRPQRASVIAVQTFGQASTDVWDHADVASPPSSPTSPHHGPEFRIRPRREADDEARMAAARMDGSDRSSVLSGSTLPPPYAVYSVHEASRNEFRDPRYRPMLKALH